MPRSSQPSRRERPEDSARRGVGPRRRAGLAALTVAGALLLVPVAEAVPRPGETLPSFSAKDLNGTEHESRELLGQRTLVVAMTDRDGGDAMQRWFDAADTRLGKGRYQSTALISLKLPFFVSGGAARGRAKEKVPQEFWEETWLDRDGRMAKVLALPKSREPFVFVVDAEGRVLASVHGPADSPEAESIWSALSKQ